MGYVVRYGETVPASVSVRATRYGAFLTVMVLLTGSAVLGSAVRGELCETVFPWTQKHVQSAFAEFREEIREGEPFMAAFEEFCREIIEDAQETP